MTEQPRYSMLIEWSEEDRLYIVSLPEWGKYAHTHGATYAEAVRHGEEVLELLIASACAEGKPLPTPRLFAHAS
jgi:predicted RNase H-like HicB family nuclease